MQEIIQKLKTIYKSDEDFQVIRYALEYAEEKHKGQLRVSGEPYINHPLKVAEILADLGMDATCVAAAILHDVLEDTDSTVAEVRKKFGEELFNLVEGVTKLSRIKYNSLEEAQAENYRKLFFAIAEDVRVLFIKLADRLHNMRTLDALKPEKQQRIAKETLDLYAPLAGRLGIANIKSELEDLAMKYLYPEDYAYLVGTIDVRRGERMSFVSRIAGEIEAELAGLGIKGEVKGRPKHFYSIYKKMRSQGKSLDQIYDLIAVRVIVENVRDCYTVLGIIHSKWKPIPGRFKDYIAMPKPNLYQSLHTTVVTDFGQVFEIQIRTYEMNRIAEYGIAAHWKYKEGKAKTPQTDMDVKLGWVKEVMDAEAEVKDGKEFVKTLKTSITSDEVYVFTPKGAVLDLPKGATAVDFAFKVHSAVGNRCVGAKINNKIVPLSTVLATGDVVEILTSPQSKGPSRDWLKFVVTSQAKAKIRAFFKKEGEGENIKTGKEMLERESKHRGFNFSDLTANTSALDRVMQRYSFTSLEDMYSSVGYGGTSTNQILIKLIDTYKKEQALRHEEPAPISEETQPQTAETAPQKPHSGILIEGFSDFLIKLARCCNPVPGDPIVGYAARGTGVSVHRADCPNIKSMERERLLKARWAASDNSIFTARLQIECMDKSGILNTIISLIAAQGFSISSIEAHTRNAGGTATIALGVQIKSVADVEYLIKKIQGIQSVNSVKRSY
jgi:(p)ppGpp synthetase, RelA/SpoT family